MKISKTWFITIFVAFFIFNVVDPIAAKDRDKRSEKAESKKEERRNKNKRKAKTHRKVKKPHKKVIVVPRRRSFRNIIVVRPHGHAYHGYGHHHSDNDAWKWLAFTAITLKILDNLNEEAQRAHETAQVKATSAPVGEKITWVSGDASGSVQTVKEGKSDNGNTCREFQQTVTIGGKTEDAHGTACLQEDGSWKMN